MKDLPKMYHTKVNKDIGSIQKVYNSMNCHDDVDVRRRSYVSIDKRIDDIFLDINFVYKADVVIVTDSDTLTKRIVARNSNYLVTIDNEYIPIAIIRDIYKKE